MDVEEGVVVSVATSTEPCTLIIINSVPVAQLLLLLVLSICPSATLVFHSGLAQPLCFADVLGSAGLTPCSIAQSGLLLFCFPVLIVVLFSMCESVFM